MAAAAVAIGVGEIFAAVIGGHSIIAAVGALVISLQPPGAKDVMVAIFGDSDKLALEVATGIGGVLLGGLLGLAARWNQQVAVGGFAAFGVVAFVLLQRDPLAGVFVSAVTASLAVGSGILVLSWLAALMTTTTTATGAEVADRVVGRRGFLGMTAAIVGVGGVLAVLGRLASSQMPVVPSSSEPVDISTPPVD